MNPIVMHLISSVVYTTLDSSRVFPKFQVHFFVYRIQCFKYTSSILIYPYHLLSLSIKFSTLLKSVLIQVGRQTSFVRLICFEASRLNTRQNVFCKGERKGSVNSSSLVFTTR